MVDFYRDPVTGKMEVRASTYGDMVRNPNPPLPEPPPRPFLTKEDCERLREPKYQFITGNAGTGKTYELRRRVAAEAGYGVLCASTGVAACNIDAVTIHSTFKFFNEASLTWQFRTGRLHRTIDELWQDDALGRYVILDEVSMFNAKCLDMMFSAVQKATDGQVGFIVTGDFAQLPPVDGEFAFKADCWPEFETTKLTKVWRQDDPAFLEALNAMRSGRQEAAGLLRDAGANFSYFLDPDFRGTTLMPVNKLADNMNDTRYAALDGPEFLFEAKTFGRQNPDWDDLKKPVRVKRGMRCMLTANDTPGFAYANGDMGDVVFVDEKTAGQPRYVIVRLDRTNEDVTIGYVTRREFDTAGRTLLGSVQFMPLKLAYALTIHKIQGLTLDKVQFDIGHWFAGSPALAYVACSRVRRASDIKIVGAVDKLASRIHCSPEVGPWL